MSLWSLDFGTWNSGDCKTHHGSVLQRIQVLARTWCKAWQVSIRWVWRSKFPRLSLYLWPNSIMHASHLTFNKLIELIPKQSFLHWIHNTFQTTSLVASLVKPHQASCLVETEWENSKQADHLRYPKPPNIALPRGGFRLFKASARMEDSRRRAKTESGINPEALLMQKSPIMVTYPTLEIVWHNKSVKILKIKSAWTNKHHENMWIKATIQTANCIGQIQMSIKNTVQHTCRLVLGAVKSSFKRRSTTEKRVEEQHHINSPKLVKPNVTWLNQVTAQGAAILKYEAQIQLRHGDQCASRNLILDDLGRIEGHTMSHACTWDAPFWACSLRWTQGMSIAFANWCEPAHHNFETGHKSKWQMNSCSYSQGAEPGPTSRQPAVLLGFPWQNERLQTPKPSLSLGLPWNLPACLPVTFWWTAWPPQTWTTWILGPSSPQDPLWGPHLAHLLPSKQ